MGKDNYTLPIIMFKMFLTIIISLLIPRMGICLDVTAASLSLADVQAAVNQVENAGGGTVFLPSGTSPYWTSYLLVPGGVNLIGHGNPTYTDPATFDTTIRFNYAGQTGIIYNYRFGINHYSRPFRVSAIRFIGHVSGSSIIHTVLSVASGKDFRINHCYFDGGNYIIDIESEVGKPSTGLIDHCTVTRGGIPMPYYGYGITVNAREYLKNKPLGTSDAVFIEDCVITDMSHPVGAFGGAHYVLRYSTINDIANDGAVDAHGPGFVYFNGETRGVRAWEIYNNTFNAPSGNNPLNWCGMRLRAGDGVIFNNIENNERHMVNFTLDSASCPSCLDAPGRGGNPVYIWNNTYNNVPEEDIFVEDVDCTRACVRLGTEIIKGTMPGYTPYTYPHPLSKQAPDSPKNLRISNP